MSGIVFYLNYQIGMKIYYLLAISGLLCNFSNKASGQCSGNNTFLGSINSNWFDAANWSANCVPQFPVIGEIIIASNCTYQDTVPFTPNNQCSVNVNENIVFSIVYGNPPIDNWSCGDVLEIGGESYPTIQFGNQCWMAKNLNLGVMILSASNQTNNNTIEKYCMDDVATNCIIYGGLYQWNEVMNYTTSVGAKGICPTGWHLPTEIEVETFYDILPEIDRGSRIATNSGLWENGALNASQYFGTTGFNALPAGLYEDGSTFSENFNTFFWLSSSTNNVAAALGLNFDSSDFLPSSSLKANGYSVRCLKN